MPRYCFITKRLLQLAIWLAFIAWIAVFFLVPSLFGRKLYNKWVASSDGSIFGKTGSSLLFYNAPLLIVVCLAILYLALFNNTTQMTRKRFDDGAKTPRVSLWTFPVCVDGPLGVVSAAELVGILVCVVFLLWSAYYYTLTNLELLNDYPDFTTQEKRELFWADTALCFGLMASACLAFLFVPVARGSIIGRLIGINFEHAIKYHIWLANLTLFLLTLHGLSYMILWTIQGTLFSSMIEWKDSGVANFAGVISYTFGLLLWTTSLPPIRKRYFEAFYYTHQLYILFLIFFALHVGEIVFSKIVGGLFLFILDRFLRFCQSRKNVTIISATSFPGGTVKLVIPKPQNLQPNALGLVFLKVGKISQLQWHPFSVSSGLIGSEQSISVHIKAVGEWTLRLKEMISSVPSDTYCSTITASVEGPYGLEIAYYMRYKYLILVAGGSGISPFLGILNDIYEQIKEGRDCVPRHVVLVWAVKKWEELSLLSSLHIHQLINEMNIEIQAYVTRQSHLLEEGEVEMISKTCAISSSSQRCNMSGLVGTAHNFWPGTYIIVTSAGFVILLSLLDTCYINPFSITWRWYKGLLFVICMVISVFVFGGLVIGVWYLWEKSSSNVKKCEENMESDNIGLLQHDEVVVGTREEELYHKTASSLSAIYFGRRPDFKEIFEGISNSWGQSDICVIVCGNSSLESSVARECRSKNWRRTREQPIFHFNSHTFNL